METFTPGSGQQMGSAPSRNWWQALHLTGISWTKPPPWPPGTFITFEERTQPYLVLADALLAWHPEGYGEPIARPNDRLVIVLTPRSVVRTLANGFQFDS